jgi:hypothetical protein
MKLEVSFPRSREPVAGRHPEPAESIVLIFFGLIQRLDKTTTFRKLILLPYSDERGEKSNLLGSLIELDSTRRPNRLGFCPLFHLKTEVELTSETMWFY